MDSQLEALESCHVLRTFCLRRDAEGSRHILDARRAVTGRTNLSGAFGIAFQKSKNVLDIGFRSITMCFAETTQSASAAIGTTRIVYRSDPVAAWTLWHISLSPSPVFQGTVGL